jgi:hypothetical protein
MGLQSHVHHGRGWRVCPACWHTRAHQGRDKGGPHTWSEKLPHATPVWSSAPALNTRPDGVRYTVPLPLGYPVADAAAATTAAAKARERNMTHRNSSLPCWSGGSFSLPSTGRWWGP